jgi:hypothetical protein
LVFGATLLVFGAAFLVFGAAFLVFGAAFLVFGAALLGLVLEAAFLRGALLVLRAAFLGAARFLEVVFVLFVAISVPASQRAPSIPYVGVMTEAREHAPRRSLSVGVGCHGGAPCLISI